MNDIRRTILMVIFGFSIILLWDRWQIHNGKNAMFFPASTPTTVTTVAPTSATTPEIPTGNSNATPAPFTGGASAVPAPVRAASAVAHEYVEVETDVLKLKFDKQGATLVGAELRKHADMADSQQNFLLLDQSPNRFYIAQSGLIGGAYPTHETPMELEPGSLALADGENTLTLRFASSETGGLRLYKTYVLQRGSYEIAVNHEVVNTGNVAASPQLYLQLVRDGTKPPGESSFYSTFTGPAIYTEAKKYQKIDFKDIKNSKAEFEKKSTDGYIAMVQHYFATAWILPQGVEREMSVGVVLADPQVPDCCYRVSAVTQPETLAPGATKTINATLYAGPQVEHNLKAVTPGLELVKDYGWLTILAKPLYLLLNFLHSFLLNWGWAIVAVVVVLKIAFYWLNAKAYASMAKMKAVNPKITVMRERLKDKPQEMQQAMMQIYRDEKVNPMGGCLPILIQIPVFIALYWVLLSSVEMRNAPWILWIHDLSSPDPYFILPLLMAATSMLQVWLNPKPPDPMQAKLMWFMPLAFSVMFFFFPSGLVLYWLTNNILSIAQQWLINKKLGVLNNT